MAHVTTKTFIHKDNYEVKVTQDYDAGEIIIEKTTGHDWVHIDGLNAIRDFKYDVQDYVNSINFN